MDTVLIDTVGDGLVDEAVPLSKMLPKQIEAQRLLVNPAFEALSIFATIALYLTFALELELNPSVAASADWLSNAELGFSVFFVFEFFTRWWSVGGSPRYLLTPLMLIDLLNILPVLVALTSPSGFSMLATDTNLAPLSLFRALRILRLRRLLGREELGKLARAVTGDPSYAVLESRRVLARVAFSAVAIVLVAAGIEWSVEREVNPMLSNYADAVYFSVTTLTTVGYGDVVPLTSAGRFVVALEMVAAITVIPFELAAFSNALEEETRELSRSSAVDTTGDGVADAVLLDTQGDGTVDTIKPLSRIENTRRQAVRCESCGLLGHERDALFCRRCGAALSDRDAGLSAESS